MNAINVKSECEVVYYGSVCDQCYYAVRIIGRTAHIQNIHIDDNFDWTFETVYKTSKESLVAPMVEFLNGNLNQERMNSVVEDHLKSTFDWFMVKVNEDRRKQEREEMLKKFFGR